MQQAYILTKYEQNNGLRTAIVTQTFDWENNPAIDLQNALSQAQMTLYEIDDNETFRETRQDALKLKLQPYYHLIADVKSTDLPDKLRHIWKHIAVPQWDRQPFDKSLRKETTMPNATSAICQSAQNIQTQTHIRQQSSRTQQVTQSDTTPHHRSHTLHTSTQYAQTHPTPDETPPRAKLDLGELIHLDSVTTVEIQVTLHVNVETKNHVSNACEQMPH